MGIWNSGEEEESVVRLYALFLTEASITNAERGLSLSRTRTALASRKDPAAIGCLISKWRFIYNISSPLSKWCCLPLLVVVL